MQSIEVAAEIARAAGARKSRLLPEFATGGMIGGHYFADYFRPNGLLPGAFDGADNILAKLSKGEMVLNPYQMAKIRALSGFDVFAHADIPNYSSRESRPRSAYASGGYVTESRSTSPTIIAPETNVEVNITMTQDSSGIWHAEATSDKGKKAIVKIVNESKQRGDIR